MNRAERTIRGAIIMALANTCELTGLRASLAADRLTNELIMQLGSPAVRWALVEWFVDLERADHPEGT